MTDAMSRYFLSLSIAEASITCQQDIRDGLERVTMLNEELEKEKRNRTLMTLALETDEKNLEESAGPIRQVSGHTSWTCHVTGKPGECPCPVLSLRAL